MPTSLRSTFGSAVRVLGYFLLATATTASEHKHGNEPVSIPAGRPILLDEAAPETEKFGDIRDEVESYEQINILHINGRADGLVKLQGTHADSHPETLELQIDHRNLTISAKRNKDFFAPGYKEVVMSSNGSVISESPGLTNCWYKGYVNNDPVNSIIHLSTCTGGINGVIWHDGKSMEIRYIKEISMHVLVYLSKHKPEKPHECHVDPEIHPKLFKPYARNHHDSHTHDHTHGHTHTHAYAELGAKLQAAGECNGGPTKFADILMVNDNRRFTLRGVDVELHTVEIFQYVSHLYFGGNYKNTNYASITDSTQQCKVQPRLTGQITYREGNPTSLIYSTGANCGAACNDGATCAGGEVAGICLLESFTTWTRTNEVALNSMFGDVDNAQLLSEHDFAGSTIGIAWVGTMCTDFSVGIDQVVGYSGAFSASVIAHEMGHNFGFNHVQQAGRIMSAAASFNPANIWTAITKSALSSFFTNDYVGNRVCLNTDSGEDRWKRPVCGNGVVEPGEECDPGIDLFASDTCCNNDCTLANNCVCSDFQACCNNGAIVSQGTTCRAPEHNTCDTAEVCDGNSPECPPDLFSTAGTACQDTTTNGVTTTGACYKGDCVSLSDSCINSAFPYAVVGRGTLNCVNVQCSSTPGGTNVINAGSALSGSPCQSDQVCLAPSETCEQAATLRFYHWNIDANDCAQCRDETDTAVDPTLCEDEPTDCTLDAGGGSYVGSNGGGGGGDGGGGGSSSNDGVIIAVVIVVIVVVIGIVAAVLWCFYFNGKSGSSSANASAIRRHSMQQISRQEEPQAQNFIAQSPATSSKPLPPNWSLHYDDNGTPYYFNHQTGESMWNRPDQAGGREIGGASPSSRSQTGNTAI